jgi:hypothetical protein
MDEQIVIHVGLHKTGTTFLQKEVFPKLGDINYIEEVGLDISLVSDKLNLISNENLDGGSYRLFNKAEKRFAIANNLKKLFPDAKIVLCLRNKESWLKSAWKQYVIAYKSYSFSEYRETLDPHFLDHEKYVRHLKGLFREVHVCWFEDLVSNPQDFVKELCFFMKVQVPENIDYSKKHNTGITDTQIQFIRLYDKLFPSKLMHLLLSLTIKLVRDDVNIEKWKGREL